MKGRLFVVAAALSVLCMLLISMVLNAAVASKSTPQATPVTVSSLPASLDGLYPPKTERPVLFLAMHDLNAALTGVVVDINENDREGAVANFQRCEQLYREIALLVPEWKSWYPAEPVEELGRVVQAGTPGEVMAAVGKVGAACHDCHVATMVPVQMRYHWPDFNEITVHDPVAGVDIDFPEFMRMLNASMTGVANDLRQDQPVNARVQFAEFSRRMAALRESCDACHDSERAYFVDTRIESLLADIGVALAGSAPDPVAVAARNQRIGEESCFKCHLVHLPAAYSRSASR